MRDSVLGKLIVGQLKIESTQYLLSLLCLHGDQANGVIKDFVGILRVTRFVYRLLRDLRRSMPFIPSVPHLRGWERQNHVGERAFLSLRKVPALALETSSPMNSSHSTAATLQSSTAGVYSCRCGLRASVSPGISLMIGDSIESVACLEKTHGTHKRPGLCHFSTSFLGSTLPVLGFDQV